MKILLVSLILLTSILAKSQKYHPIIGENKRWVIKETLNFYCPLSEPEPDKIRYFFQFFDGDTIINNINYIKGYRQDFYFTNQYDSTNNELQQAKLSFFMREDIKSKSIYSHTRFRHTETLNFDFSLEKGDTLVCAPGVIIPIVGIDTINLNDGSNRRLYRNSSCYSGFVYGLPNFVIEGVGGEGGLTYNYPIPTEGKLDHELICYFENGIELFGDCDYPNYFIVGTKDNLSQQEVEYKPIPADDHFVVSTKIPFSSNVRLLVIDIRGRILMTKHIGHQSDVLIDTSIYEAGLYIIALYEKKALLGFKKIVINHN